MSLTRISTRSLRFKVVTTGAGYDFDIPVADLREAADSLQGLVNEMYAITDALDTLAPKETS